MVFFNQSGAASHMRRFSFSWWLFSSAACLSMSFKSVKGGGLGGAGACRKQPNPSTPRSTQPMGIVGTLLRRRQACCRGLAKRLRESKEPHRTSSSESESSSTWTMVAGGSSTVTPVLALQSVRRVRPGRKTGLGQLCTGNGYSMQGGHRVRARAPSFDICARAASRHTRSCHSLRAFPQLQHHHRARMADPLARLKPVPAPPALTTGLPRTRASAGASCTVHSSQARSRWAPTLLLEGEGEPSQCVRAGVRGLCVGGVQLPARRWTRRTRGSHRGACASRGCVRSR